MYEYEYAAEVEAEPGREEEATDSAEPMREESTDSSIPAAQEGHQLTNKSGRVIMDTKDDDFVYATIDEPKNRA